jgi:hypothetical protein
LKTDPAASAEEITALLRVDFASFAQAAFAELYPQTRFAPAWHLELIAAKLAAVGRREIRRLIVNLPPRHAKSLLASVAFPAWCLGHEPSLQILCASYAQELADKLSRDCRRIVASPWYRRLFPTRLSAVRQAMAEFETTAQGFRLATSVGGVLTGRGADLIVIDDPLKPEEALSEAQRRAANEWFDHTLYSRLNDKQEGAIVLIMHRLHEDDLTGHVLAQEAWEHLRLSALAEAEECHALENFWGCERIVRPRGAPLQPEREGAAVLARIRRTIGEYNFAGQYQQTPAPLGGGLVKSAWFARYRPVDRWDTANKATELSDFSVCTNQLGHPGQAPLPARRRARTLRLPRIEAPGARRAAPLAGRCRPDRGQGLGHPADPGIARRGDARGHQLPAAGRQDHADLRADRDDRERPERHRGSPSISTSFRASPMAGTTIRSIRPRRCSTGSRRPGAKTASTPITACSARSAAARNVAEPDAER